LTIEAVTTSDRKCNNYDTFQRKFSCSVWILTNGDVIIATVERQMFIILRHIATELALSNISINYMQQLLKFIT